MNACKWIVCVMLMVGGTVAAAQGPPPPPHHPPGGGPGMGRPAHDDWADRDVRELVGAVMMVRLSRRLGLDDEQTVLMMRRFDEFKEKEGRLKKERQEKMRALRAAVEGDAPAADVDAALEALEAHDRVLAQTKFELFEQAGAGLSAKQRAKLYVFMGEFENEMRSLVQQARRRAMARPDGFRDGPPRFPEGRPQGPRGFRRDGGPKGGTVPPPRGRQGGPGRDRDYRGDDRRPGPREHRPGEAPEGPPPPPQPRPEP